MEKGSGSLFYGWWIVIAGMVLITVTIGTHMSFGVFFKPIMEEFGWTRTTTAAGFFVGGLAIAVTALSSGALTDRYGPRLVITGVGLINGVGYFLMSQVSSLWQFYLVFPMMALGMSIVTPLLTTVSRWFTDRRGLALGLVGVGAGLGQAIMPPITHYLVTQYGWRQAYMILSVVVGLTVVSAAQAVRRDPREKGLWPYGEAPDAGPGGASVSAGEERAPPPAFSLRQVVHLRVFWMILLSGALGSLGMQMTMIHLVPHVTDVGISAAVAATMLGIIGFTNIIGKVVMGWLADRIGAKTTLAITNAMAGMVMLWLLRADEEWMLYGFAIAFGFAFGGWMTLLAATAGEVFGVASLGAIFGTMQAGTATFGTGGTVMAGYVFDVTQSYLPAFAVGAIAFLAAAGLVMGARRPPRTSPLG